MAPIQGKEAVRLSPLLLQILEEFQSERPLAGVAGRAPAVAELSRLFTKGREALGTDYLKNPALADAYLSYFFPVNLCKVQVLLAELPEDWHAASGDQPLRVLDLGGGPGTGALAVLDWLNQNAPNSPKKLTVVAVDVSSEVLHQARRLWDAYAQRAAMDDVSLILCEGDLASARSGGWQEKAVQQGPYDLIIVANCLNELFNHTHDSIKARATLIEELLERLTPHGTLMLIEPALRETSRALHLVRDQLLLEQQCTIYSPCLHENNCPALLNPDDWCHEERAWEPPATIRQIDREVGFIKDALKFSYLLLRTDGRTIAVRSADTFRMVSELRKLKGDTRAWLCNELGRSELGRLDRAQSASNSSWEQCQRGTIVRIDGMTRKDGAVLGRIPAEAAVEIVRPT